MAAATTFSDIGLNAARIASGMDYMNESKPDPRSSMYITDRGLSRWDRIKARFRRAGKSVGKLFRKKDKEQPELSDHGTDSTDTASDITRELHCNLTAMAQLEGLDRPPTADTAISQQKFVQWSHDKYPRGSKLSVHSGPGAPAPAPASDSGSSVVDSTPERAAAGDASSAEASTSNQTRAFEVLAESSSSSLPLSNEHYPSLSLLKGNRQTYAGESSVPDYRPRKPAYTSLGAPPGNDGRIYLAAGQSIGERFDVYGNSPYASSTALPTDNNNLTELSFLDSPSTTSSYPEPPFSPTPAKRTAGGDRHSKFAKKIDVDCTFTGGLAPRASNPEPPSPGSAEFLNNVYFNPPTPPPQEPVKSQRDTLKVPVPPCKPVPPQASSTAGPSQPLVRKPDVNKSLPPTPGPQSPRRFSPASNSYFPPRTDSLNNPIAAAGQLRPSGKLYMDPAKVPSHMNMLDNGYEVLDARKSRESFAAEPKYERSTKPMNHMDEKERDYKLKREASRREAEAKAAAKAKAKAEKKIREDEKAVRKLLFGLKR